MRYVRASRAAYVPKDILFPERVGSLDVYPLEPQDTGLVFPDGTPIMRVPDEIGFVPRGEA